MQHKTEAQVCCHFPPNHPPVEAQATPVSGLLEGHIFEHARNASVASWKVVHVNNYWQTCVVSWTCVLVEILRVRHKRLYRNEHPSNRVPAPTTAETVAPWQEMLVVCFCFCEGFLHTRKSIAWNAKENGPNDDAEWFFKNQNHKSSQTNERVSSVTTVMPLTVDTSISPFSLAVGVVAGVLPKRKWVCQEAMNLGWISCLKESKHFIPCEFLAYVILKVSAAEKRGQDSKWAIGDAFGDASNCGTQSHDRHRETVWDDQSGLRLSLWGRNEKKKTKHQKNKKDL